MSKAATQMFPGDYPTVFAAVCTAAQAEAMHIQLADVATGRIHAKADASLWSWGENATIQVGVDQAGAIFVSVHSGLKFGLFDWGKNQANINRLFWRIGDVLRSGQPAPVQAPPGAWHPDPTTRHQFRWWNGTSWTEHVSDAGVTGSDPV